MAAQPRFVGLLAAFTWLLFLAWTLAVSALGLIVAGTRCNDGCHTGPGAAGHWTLLEDAWQWDAIRYLAIANLVGGILLLGELLVRARMPVVVATYGIQGACALALGALVLDGERYHVGPLTLLLIVTAAIGPLAIGFARVDRARAASPLSDA